MEAVATLDFAFDTMVRGDENLLAISGALKVLAEPGQKYNPFFVFGSPSVGKTHLINALRISIEREHPEWNVLMLPAGEFLEECEAAWQNDTTGELRRTLWQLDALLIDDVHLLAHRPAALQELYHLSNQYLAHSRQLVLTSRFAPSELDGFQQDLCVRFKSGLVVSLDMPRERMMRDILEQKCQITGLRPTRKATRFLCNEVRSVRDLDGILHQLAAPVNGRARRISLAEVRDVLEKHSTERTTVADIAKAVCQYFRADIGKVRSASRQQSLVQARQVAMYLAREMTTAPLTEIGHFFGGRDHTTVLYAYRKVAESIRGDSHLSRAAREIRGALRA